jgi:hypothetical protein
MKHGIVAEAFMVQHGRRTLYVKRVVDSETRGDQPAAREQFTLRARAPSMSSSTDSARR